MKRLVIATLLLFAATILVTVAYFRHLSTTTEHNSLVMATIPDNASFIFEFSNDKDFYDIFAGNQAFSNILGPEKAAELTFLHKELVDNAVIEKYLHGQNVYVSMHPEKGNSIDFLFTAGVSKDFRNETLSALASRPARGTLVQPTTFGSKPGYVLYFSGLKKRFYLFFKDEQALVGSFSRELVDGSARYQPQIGRQAFVLLPDQQNASSLANLYVNYRALTPLAEQLFIGRNPDIFRSLRQFSGFGALTLNFRSDALLFSGVSQFEAPQDEGYLALFARQRPVVNHLKEIFPSTTAYSSCFSISDPARFLVDLSAWQAKNRLTAEKNSTLARMRMETGMAIDREFSKLLGNEFAVVTTRYQEKIGLIQIKDGTKMLAALYNISKMTAENSGQFNYERLPQFLLGYPFIVFKKPYFTILDNYLVLANTATELASYNDSYLNRKFLSKTGGYNDFNNLLGEQSNIAFFIQLKNARQLFHEEMKAPFFFNLDRAEPGWKFLYGASWQFTAADKNFYTNFCIGMHPDTSQEKMLH